MGRRIQASNSSVVPLRGDYDFSVLSIKRRSKRTKGDSLLSPLFLSENFHKDATIS